MATGTTAEGTTWTTRPMSPEIEARYTCEHRGGVLKCGYETAKQCEKTRWDLERKSWIAPEGAKVKRYSPATPAGNIRPALPASVSIGLLDVFATARRRLDGLEPWPVIVESIPARPKIAADPKFTRAYREFIAAIRAAGFTPAYPIAAQPREHTPRRALSIARGRKHEPSPSVHVQAGQIWEDCDKRHGGRRVEILRVESGRAVTRAARHDPRVATAHSCRILLTRFRPTSTGYRLVAAEG